MVGSVRLGGPPKETSKTPKNSKKSSGKPPTPKNLPGNLRFDVFVFGVFLKTSIFDSSLPLYIESSVLKTPSAHLAIIYCGFTLSRAANLCSAKWILWYRGPPSGFFIVEVRQTGSLLLRSAKRILYYLGPPSGFFIIEVRQTDSLRLRSARRILYY